MIVAPSHVSDSRVSPIDSGLTFHVVLTILPTVQDAPCEARLRKRSTGLHNTQDMERKAVLLGSVSLFSLFQCLSTFRTMYNSRQSEERWLCLPA